ncbi:hypothetical protein WMY93_000904 [Mugilogobius chulae]|uniref:Uncharacterized protein n=1 Tax=Mugilogobius chulae TaxID=88201 RepID=A0AAW0Q271_9GOBI
MGFKLVSAAEALEHGDLPDIAVADELDPQEVVFQINVFRALLQFQAQHEEEEEDWDDEDSSDDTSTEEEEEDEEDTEEEDEEEDTEEDEDTDEDEDTEVESEEDDQRFPPEEFWAGWRQEVPGVLHQRAETPSPSSSLDRDEERVSSPADALPAPSSPPAPPPVDPALDFVPLGGSKRHRDEDEEEEPSSKRQRSEDSSDDHAPSTSAGTSWHIPRFGVASPVFGQYFPYPPFFREPEDD